MKIQHGFRALLKYATAQLGWNMQLHSLKSEHSLKVVGNLLENVGNNFSIDQLALP